MLFNCGLGWYFSDDQWYWPSHYIPVGYLYVLSGVYYICKYFNYFWIRLFLFSVCYSVVLIVVCLLGIHLLPLYDLKIFLSLCRFLFCQFFLSCAGSFQFGLIPLNYFGFSCLCFWCCISELLSRSVSKSWSFAYVLFLQLTTSGVAINLYRILSWFRAWNKDLILFLFTWISSFPSTTCWKAVLLPFCVLCTFVK